MAEATFIIRNNPKFIDYIRYAWRYFLHDKKMDGCSITIRKNDVFIHISKLYCVIFNDLCHIAANPDDYRLEMNNQARELLEKYKS